MHTGSTSCSCNNQTAVVLMLLRTPPGALPEVLAVDLAASGRSSTKHRAESYSYHCEQTKQPPPQGAMWPGKCTFGIEATGHLEVWR